MTQTLAQSEFAETFKEFCEQLKLEHSWSGEELLCLNPLPASTSPRILINFAPEYWRIYAQRSGAAKAQARAAVLGVLTRKLPALRSHDRHEVYTIRAVMIGGI